MDAIKSIPAQTQTPVLGSINWTPIIQGVVSGVATSFGATVNFPTATAVLSSKPSSSLETSPPITPSPTTANLTPLETRISTLESKFGSLESAMTQLTSTVSTMAQGQTQLTEAMTAMSDTVSHMGQIFSVLTSVKRGGSSSSSPASTPSGAPSSPSETPPESGSSTAPPKSPPFSLPEIASLEEVIPLDTYKEFIANTCFYFCFRIYGK